MGVLGNIGKYTLRYGAGYLVGLIAAGAAEEVESIYDKDRAANVRTGAAVVFGVKAISDIPLESIIKREKVETCKTTGRAVFDLMVILLGLYTVEAAKYIMEDDD